MTNSGVAESLAKILSTCSTLPIVKLFQYVQRKPKIHVLQRFSVVFAHGSLT